MKYLSLFVFYLCIQAAIYADDGYRLWLKYDLIEDPALLKSYRSGIRSIRLNTTETPVTASAVRELKTGLQGLLGKTIGLSTKPSTSAQIILALVPPGGVINHEEGYRLVGDKKNIRIEALTDRGLLYGSFALLAYLQQARSLDQLNLVESPKINLRLLNHWDNPNGTIERGYAGSTLWKWYDLPDQPDARYWDYARANASIGINGTVVNNVNASARFLSREYLVKVVTLAAIFRQYGIKTYLSIRFTAPTYLDSFKTADPLDPAVRQWWKEKASEIYTLIPDFGGFLVKANPNNDRAAESYNEFKPLDGQFRDNVLVQVKNGPIDFQPREPFHPLFGAMPRTPLMMEFQITQEYLGFATHWVYLACLFKEVLDSDTYAGGAGSTVARIIDGSVEKHRLTGIAGVANTGSDRNWCGHIGNQANWYVYGRLAWNPDRQPGHVAEDWIRMTLTRNKPDGAAIKKIMMESHETCVNYMTPLGLHQTTGPALSDAVAPKPIFSYI